MNAAVVNNAKVDVAIFTAAVSDFTIKKSTSKKIKKEKFNKILLKKNPDIIKNISLKKIKKPKFIVGFAAETNNHINNAKKKLIEKGCDLVIVNKINKKNDVFGSDFNQVSFITHDKIIKLKKMTKIDVAKSLISKIIDNFYNSEVKISTS